MNKNLLTNIISFSIMILGAFSPLYQNIIFSIGLFSLSGGLTNWLAIYMLFEKIPLIYGSGIIPNKFELIKEEIKKLIFDEFFTEKNLKTIVMSEVQFDPDHLIESVGKNNLFSKFVEAIEESSLGNMLTLVGGKAALEPLKDPLIEKMRIILKDFSKISENGNTDLVKSIKSQVENIIEIRLNELSSDDITKIIKEMIESHLGWLVIWGAVVGGFIGFIVGYLNL
mgnify:FL=1